MTATHALSYGSMVHDYRIENILGEGSFGLVYKAIDQRNNNTVALKMLKTWSMQQELKSSLEKRFYLEFETGKIQSKNLVKTHEINRYEDIPYFIMDYFDGGNLQSKIAAKSIPNSQSANFALGILNGLHDLHLNGKIHRDLKPENILFDKKENPYLSDFGIAGHFNIQLTIVNHEDSPEHIIGSYAYMAPEQLTAVKRQNTILPTVDIFAFGVVCYEMMTGHLPFGPWQSTYDLGPYLERAQKGDFDDVAKYNSCLPIEWHYIIDKCLKPKREDRYQRVIDIYESLNMVKEEQVAKPYSGKISITVLDGDEVGNSTMVNLTQQKSLLLIGRADGEIPNDVAIVENYTSFISRKHCSIEWMNGNVYIRDGQWSQIEKKWIYSKNGTYVNGIKVDHGKSILICNNDVLIIGNTSLKLNY